MQGNDLSTARLPGFPGLRPGDRWCLCAARWKEALQAGMAPTVVLEASHRVGELLNCILAAVLLAGCLECGQPGGDEW